MNVLCHHPSLRSSSQVLPWKLEPTLLQLAPLLGSIQECIGQYWTMSATLGPFLVNAPWPKPQIHRPPPQSAQRIVLDGEPCDNRQHHEHHGGPCYDVDLGAPIVRRHEDLADVKPGSRDPCGPHRWLRKCEDSALPSIIESVPVRNL